MLRSERPDEGYDDDADDEGEEDEREADFDVVHEAELSRSEDEGVWRGCDRCGERAGGGDADRHDDRVRCRADGLRDGDGDGREECRCRRVGHELGQPAREDEHCRDDEHRRGRIPHESDDDVRDELSRAAALHGVGEREHPRKKEDRCPVDAAIRLFLGQAARQDAGERADDGGGLHGDADALFEYHGEDDGAEDDGADDHFARILFLLRGLLGSALQGEVTRTEAPADREHVDHAREGEGDADPREFKEAKGAQMRSLQRCAHEDVWRCADHRDRAADVRGDGERHELRRDGDLCRAADLDDDGHQTRDGRRVRGDRREDDRDEHEGSHQRALVRARLLDDGDADLLCQPRAEHRRTDDEHARKEDDGGVRQPRKDLCRRQHAEQSEDDCRTHCRDGERNDFGRKEHRRDGEDDERQCCLIHRFFSIPNQFSSFLA